MVRFTGGDGTFWVLSDCAVELLAQDVGVSGAPDELTGEKYLVRRNPKSSILPDRAWRTSQQSSTFRSSACSIVVYVPYVVRFRRARED